MDAGRREYRRSQSDLDISNRIHYEEKPISKDDTATSSVVVDFSKKDTKRKDNKPRSLPSTPKCSPSLGKIRRARNKDRSHSAGLPFNFHIRKSSPKLEKKIQIGRVEFLETVLRVDGDSPKNSPIEQPLREIVHGILPISYEDEIVQKKFQILRDPLKDVLLFPDDDLKAYTIPRELRTEKSTVPPEALSQASNLFVKECIRNYTSNWNVIENRYGQYSGSYNKLSGWPPRLEDGLLEQVFEMDLDEADSSEGGDEVLAPLREKGVSKTGYLTKAPFHYESGPAFGAAKTYKRRWFNMRQISTDGSYVLEYRKDDKQSSNTAKGALYLEACTQIRRGLKGRMYGFELHIQDKVYGLAADSQSEMDSWLESLCKVTGIDMDTGKSSVNIFGGKQKNQKITSMKESLKNSKHPELVEFSKESDQLNAKRRKENRFKLFSLVPDLDPYIGLHEEERIEARVFSEQFGIRFIVKCEDLKFRLTRTVNKSTSANVEPFFCTLAIFDVKEGKKISEDFHVDLNEPSTREMLDERDHITNGSSEDSNGETVHHQSTKVTHEYDSKYSKQAVFSVTYPNPDVFLVVRIEKVLQGSISSCAEPYIKSGDTNKIAQKVYKQSQLYCRILGQYSMPFGWAARPLFKNYQGDLDLETDCSPVYKQDNSKLSDEDMIKLLSDMTSKDKFKQQVIPGTVSLTVQKFQIAHPNCITPSYVPVKPYHESLKVPATLEIQEFLPPKAEAAHPQTVYMNHFYVYPLNINYSNQKVFAKARNIAIVVEFKDKDVGSVPGLNCIYNTDGTPTFTTSATASVLHHNTYPTFYQEVKVLLPTQLSEKHHVLFTFYHISCEQSKSGSQSSGSFKKHPTETQIGYAWLPILQNGRICDDESNLFISCNLPDGYLSYQTVGMGKYTGAEVKLVDSNKPLFRVNTRLVSTIYTQDIYLNNFFNHCQDTNQSPGGELEMAKLLKLLHSVEENTLISFLPVIFNQLFHVLLHTIVEDVSLNLVRVLIHITSKVHEADKDEILKSYVKYVFVTESAVNSSKTVHEELAKNMMTNLKPGADPVVITNLLKHSWFFFELIVKSMAQNIVNSEKMKKPNRDTRFPESYKKSIEYLLQAFVLQIINKMKDQGKVAKDANTHLAYFVKDCFTYMDRGFVFQMISYYSEQFKEADTQMLEFKFEFLRVVCNHEHYIALNLPLDVRTLGGIHDCELTDEFCKTHFLAGLLLREVSSALTEGRHIRKIAVRILRNILIKHELDSRYDSMSKQSRIAALYLPFLSVLLQHAPRFQDAKYGDISASISQASSFLPSDLNSEPVSNRSSIMSTSIKPSPSQTMTSSTASTLMEASKVMLQAPFDEEDSKELLLVFLYILKNLEQGIILDWWRQLVSFAAKRPHWHPTVLYLVHQDKQYAKFAAVIDVFDLMELCLKHFKYSGKKNIQASNSPTESTKQYFEHKYSNQNFNRPTRSSIMRSASGTTAIDCALRVLYEGNLANEVGLIVLDMIELFANHFKFHLEQDEGDNILMKKVFGVLMCFLQIPQSESMLKHVFASLRSFVNKFSVALFKGKGNHCGVLCYEILNCCNSKLESLRTQACAFLYLLMRSNYEFSHGQGCVRVHLQVIVAVSRLIATGLNRASMNQSLSTIKNYVADDKGVKNTSFPMEVRDLTKKVHTVLQATSQMKEYEDVPEMLVDLQYSLAKSYSSTPELRQAWLENMASVHEKNRAFSETANCYIHAAALVAEYLKRTGVYPEGCLAFRKVSPNVVADECVMKSDEGTLALEQRYTLKDLVDLLETSCDYLQKAELYEIMGEVYKLAIPIYEQERNFSRLAVAYKKLAQAYDKVVDVMATGKRLLGTYFRIAFFGQSFREDDGKEYIYKEHKVTTLPEISHRLESLYGHKYGAENVKIILESAKVNPDDLDVKINYIQISYVEPFFDEEELNERVTEFEKTNNIRRFVFETPFTHSGKVHGTLNEQCKRKTILTTSHSFPYVKKRILVVQAEQYELTPVEVGIDEMQNKVKELTEVINRQPPDMKRLQLKLQGSVSVQVNAGPLAYATAFLDKVVRGQNPLRHTEKLQTVYRDFIRCCGEALDLNDQLIKGDQKMYQEDMRDKYCILKTELAKYLDDPETLTLDISSMKGSWSSLA